MQLILLARIARVAGVMARTRKKGECDPNLQIRKVTKRDEAREKSSARSWWQLFPLAPPLRKEVDSFRPMVAELVESEWGDECA